MSNVQRRVVAGFLLACCVVGTAMSGGPHLPTRTELMEHARDNWVILRALLRDRKRTGALGGSSPWLVENLIQYVPTDHDVRVLDAGAGPGPVSRRAYERMTPRSKLVGVESEPQPYERLKAWADGLGDDRVQVDYADMQDWEPRDGKPFDVIISTIPETQLGLPVAQRISERYDALLKPDGVLVTERLWGARDFTGFRKGLAHWALWAASSTASGLRTAVDACRLDRVECKGRRPRDWALWVTKGVASGLRGADGALCQAYEECGQDRQEFARVMAHLDGREAQMEEIGRKWTCANSWPVCVTAFRRRGDEETGISPLASVCSGGRFGSDGEVSPRSDGSRDLESGLSREESSPWREPSAEDGAGPREVGFCHSPDSLFERAGLRYRGRRANSQDGVC